MGSSFRLLKILRVLFSERIDELLPQPKRRFLKALAWCTRLYVISVAAASV